jgi:hypothetical protein
MKITFHKDTENKKWIFQGEYYDAEILQLRFEDDDREFLLGPAETASLKIKKLEAIFRTHENQQKIIAEGGKLSLQVINGDKND